jgi:hypothetical protein
VGHTGSIRTPAVGTHFGRLQEAIGDRIRRTETFVIASEREIEVYPAPDESGVERDPDIVQVPSFLDQSYGFLYGVRKVIEECDIGCALFTGLNLAGGCHSDQSQQCRGFDHLRFRNSD